MAILFLKGTSASYHAPGFTPQPDVFYYLTDEPSFYLGKMKLSNADDVAAAVQSIAKNAEDILNIQNQLAKLENNEATDGSIRNIIRSYIDDALSSTSTNAVQNKVVKAALDKKVDRLIENADGSKALIFNEADGGGAKFEHQDGTWSFAGVNSGGENGLTGQLYTVDHGNGNLGTRLNMTLNGFYYTKNKNNATFEASDELATIRDVESASGSAASKTVYLVDTSAGQSDYAKQYKLYQGADASDMSNNNLIGSINIPLDKVLKDSSIVTITFSDGKLYDGMVDVTDLIVPVGTPTEADAGKYLKMEMQNVDNPLYVSVQEFSDIYTAAAGAAQVQLTIDEHNVISAALVPGSVGTIELADGAVTAAKLGADAVALFDEAGAAAAVLGTSEDQAGDYTVYGAVKAAEAAVLQWGEF